MTQMIQQIDNDFDEDFLTPLNQRNSCKKWYGKNRELVLKQRREEWREKKRFNIFFYLAKLIGVKKRESQSLIRTALLTNDLKIEVIDPQYGVIGIPLERFVEVYELNKDLQVVECDYCCDGKSLTLCFFEGHLVKKQ